MLVLPPLVHVEAAGGIVVDLLQHDKIRVGLAQNALDADHVVRHDALGLRVHGRAAVHEEIGVLAQPAVAGVEGEQLDVGCGELLRRADRSRLGDLGIGGVILRDGQIAQQTADQNRKRQRDGNDDLSGDCKAAPDLAPGAAPLGGHPADVCGVRIKNVLPVVRFCVGRVLLRLVGIGAHLIAVAVKPKLRAARIVVGRKVCLLQAAVGREGIAVRRRQIVGSGKSVVHSVIPP